jgi:molybdopterin molybdotransferase
MALTPLSDALATVLAALPAKPDTEQVSLDDALNRVLAVTIMSRLDVPAADNSAMDGYALRAGDVPSALAVSQRIAAGQAPVPLAPGTAARIFTGAIMPEGADTVVMQEDALERDGQVSILGCITPGQHVRRRGADIAAGAEVMAAGKVLTPQDIGLLAAVGCASVTVYRRLRVAVLSTGDELVTPGESERAPWQVYNSNQYQLSAQLRALGLIPVVFDPLPDNPEIIGDALEHATQTADVLLTTGGVSVGEEDHVRGQIEARGELALWKLAIKPGKPLSFGHVGNTPIFGLPGNPVSAWVTFALVVKPWLLHAQGITPQPMHRITVCAGFEVNRAGTREEYLRVKLLSTNGYLRAELAGNQSSGVLSSVSAADAVAVIPVGRTVALEDEVEVLLMSELLTAPYS